MTRPVRELKGFRRVHLKPGEKQTVSFPLTTDELKFTNAQNQFIVEPGKFQVWIAPNSAAGVQGEFTVTQ
jgi:beta-glucosidase